MKIGNILASIGIVIGVIGLLCLPLWNLNEMPFLADFGYGKGGGWILLASSGVFKKPGIFMVLVGSLFYYGAKLLPRKYWKTAEDLFEEQVHAGNTKHLK